MVDSSRQLGLEHQLPMKGAAVDVMRQGSLAMSSSFSVNAKTSILLVGHSYAVASTPLSHSGIMKPLCGKMNA